MGDSEGQESLACCSLCDWKESDTTEQLNSNNKDRHRAEEKELEQTGCVSRAEGSLEALSSAVCSQRLWWCPPSPSGFAVSACLLSSRCLTFPRHGLCPSTGCLPAHPTSRRGMSLSSHALGSSHH